MIRDNGYISRTRQRTRIPLYEEQKTVICESKHFLIRARANRKMKIDDVCLEESMMDDSAIVEANGIWCTLAQCLLDRHFN